MKIIFQYQEGRETRQTETVIPDGLNWENVVKYIVAAARKAYKYSNEPLPEGVTEGEL